MSATHAEILETANTLCIENGTTFTALGPGARVDYYNRAKDILKGAEAPELPVISPVIAERTHSELPISIRILGPSKHSAYFKVQVTTDARDVSQGWPTEAEARCWANTMWAYSVASIRQA